MFLWLFKIHKNVKKKNYNNDNIQLQTIKQFLAKNWQFSCPTGKT